MIESDLSGIRADIEQGGTEPDEETKSELQDYGTQREKQERQAYQDYIEARKLYMPRIFWLMVVWMGVVLAVIVVSGIHVPLDQAPLLPSWFWWALRLAVPASLAVGLGIWSTRHWALRVEVRWSWWARRIVDVAGVAVASIGLTILATSPLLWQWLAAFELPEPVVLALIGGTTANVIGLFLVVARYLFPRQDNGERG